MAYDAVKMADWQISEAAEPNMPTPEEWREKLGLEKDEILPMGRLAKLDFLKIINRLQDQPDGKYGRRQKHHFLRFDGRPRQTR
jgi:formate--tetrahydrofolate ligase